MPTKGRKLPNCAVANEMGQRVSHWMRQAYPRDGAKLAAIDFGASPHTTRRWFNGALPENRHLGLMAQKWGKRFVAFVFEPFVGPWRDYTLDEELNDLRGRLARLETDIEQTRADDRSGIRTMSAMAAPASRRLAREASGDVAATARVVEREDDAA